MALTKREVEQESKYLLKRWRQGAAEAVILVTVTTLRFKEPVLRSVSQPRQTIDAGSIACSWALVTGTCQYRHSTHR